MISDIPENKVSNVALAMVPDPNPEGEAESGDIWNAYLVNLNEFPLDYVIISVKGYGELEGEKKVSTTMRYVIETLPPKSYARIEPVMEEVLALNNEYWVSFFHNKKLFDKKYIFLPETIHKSNLTKVPLMERDGVLIM